MLATFDSLRRLRPYLGTFVEIAVEGASAAAMEEAVEAAFAAIRTVHMLMSFHEEDSDVSRLNQSAFETTVTVHPWTFQVLETALDLHCRSDGTFDIRIAPYLQKHGLLPYHFGGSLTPAPLPSNRCGIELFSGQRVRFQDRSTKIDLGGIAKGFAVDRAIGALHYHGMPFGLVNAGGDLAAFGPRSVPITISDPSCRGQVLAQVYLRNGTLASSGPAFDPFESRDAGMPAIIDPSTGKPSSAMIGATVRASSCLLADALTKVVMIGAESSLSVLRHFGASALAMSAEGEVFSTPEWEDGAVLAA
jgi:thiamine biosynthesis lipoprotein